MSSGHAHGNPAAHAPRPVLTFIIPAYNAAATLKETLASLRAQTTNNWCAIVVDDGSTDGTSHAAERPCDTRVRVITQANTGLAGARNTGLRHCSTPLVSFLDADDTLHPGFAGAMTAALGENDIVACAYAMMNEHGQPLNWITRPAAHNHTLERLIENNSFLCNVVARRDRLLECALPPGSGQVFDDRLRVLEDWDLWLRAVAAGLRWAPTVAEPLVNYRLLHGLSRNIEHMWRTGVGVISRAATDPALKDRALRRWRLRNAARALAYKDAGLAVDLLAAIEPLGGDDLTVLAETLRPAFQRARLIGPADTLRHEHAWRDELASAVGGRAWAADLLTRFKAMTNDWAAAARHIAQHLGPRDTPTIYGMGWNGQSLFAELAALLPGRAIAWMDDHPGAAAPAGGVRITISDLTPQNVVAITPNNPGTMLATLSRCKARVVWPCTQVMHDRLSAA